MHILRQLSALCCCSLALAGWSQCANNNVLTGAAVTPACPGTTNVPCVQGGQYALVNVVAGNTYTFSTCAATFDTEITLYNNAGGGSLGYNDDACGLQSTVVWPATFTGQLRVLVDAFPCLNNTTCAPLSITCAAPPAGDCIYTLTLYDSFSDGWGTSFVGVSINGGPFTNYTIAAGLPTVSFQIGVNIGDIVVLNYNNSGAFQTDNSYVLLLNGAALFNSGTPPAAGVVFTNTVDCTPPPAAQEDCIGAMTICSNTAFSNNTTNTGNISDIGIANSGCLDIVEYQGTWYVFSPSSSGNIGLSIAPLGPDDYDWAIWGPYPTGSTPASICPPAGPPIRCAASSGPATFAATGSYATGMGHATYSPPQFASTAVSYGLPATLNVCPLVPPQYCGWVPGIQATVGQVYLMYISNWSQSSLGFNLGWTLQNGASLDCTVLPIELLSFDAVVNGPAVDLHWSTAHEQNNDRFVVERAGGDNNYTEIGDVAASGTSQTTTHYGFTDRAPLPGLNHYRLRQVDEDGHWEHSPVRTVMMVNDAPNVHLFPNPGTDELEIVTNAASTFIVQLFDATGRVVMEASFMGSRCSLSTGHLPSGVYGVRLVTHSGQELGIARWMKP